jgi:hypothetical protein
MFLFGKQYIQYNVILVPHFHIAAIVVGTVHCTSNCHGEQMLLYLALKRAFAISIGTYKLQNILLRTCLFVVNTFLLIETSLDAICSLHLLN